MRTIDILTHGTIGTLLLFSLIGCGSGSSNESSTPTANSVDTSNVQSPQLVIPIDGNTVREFDFLDENVLFTRGCVTASLYDSSNSELVGTGNTAFASEGKYTYIANKFFNNNYTAYSIVYATSMSTVPEALINGTTYSYPAGAVDIKKLIIDEAKTLIATATSSAHIKVYDSNLNFVDDLYVISQQITLNAGTYYLLLSNGSCQSSTNITVNIL